MNDFLKMVEYFEYFEDFKSFINKNYNSEDKKNAKEI